MNTIEQAAAFHVAGMALRTSRREAAQKIPPHRQRSAAGMSFRGGARAQVQAGGELQVKVVDLPAAGVWRSAGPGWMQAGPAAR